MMIYNTVYPLADVLQMELGIFKKDGVYELRGYREFKFPLSKKSDFTVKATVEGSYISAEESAILLKLVKDMWVYLTYTKADMRLRFYVLSLEKVNAKSFKKMVDGQPLETALMAVRPLTRKVFFKLSAEKEWETVTLNPKQEDIAIFN